MAVCKARLDHSLTLLFFLLGRKVALGTTSIRQQQHPSALAKVTKYARHSPWSIYTKFRSLSDSY